MFGTPILFIVFNRPDTAAKVFERIRAAQPKRLYIAADGPRQHMPEDAENCRKTRAIVSQVDWECEVKTLFREENLGCGVAPAQAITWFFNHVEQGIILEDDCFPDLSFFSFCETLLNYYHDDEWVMHISGNNFQLGRQIGDGSYYFSQIAHIWGWATWRRVWNQFSFNLNNLETFIEKNTELDPFWIDSFRYVQKEQPKDIWDCQYNYVLFKNAGKAIMPNINLVTNIGFNEDATHTKGAVLYYYNQDFGSINHIRHPTINTINKAADQFTVDTYYVQKNTLAIKIRYNIKRIKDKIFRTFCKRQIPA
ncbi:MAG: nucleotide-diphospho-sugar transferase [Sphingobacteriales bacterium]|nr:nucleotide-diphospho-sugar transferase [Sphingobacteriales bacterium]